MLMTCRVCFKTLKMHLVNSGCGLVLSGLGRF